MPGNNGAPGHCQGETCGRGDQGVRERKQRRGIMGKGLGVRGLREGSEVWKVRKKDLGSEAMRSGIKQ